MIPSLEISHAWALQESNLDQSAIDPVNACGLLGSDFFSLITVDSDGASAAASVAALGVSSL